MPDSARRLKHALTVVIPVYNAPREVRALVESLETVAPAPQENLQFIFSDDASVDDGLLSVWRMDFFKRSDVQVMRNERNLGFIENVNQCFGRAQPGSDILLVNSDTLLYGRVLQILQEEAYAHDRTASVTPLTNNGTIASLFDFPAGGELPQSVTPRQVASLVEKLAVRSAPLDIPTGIGFCLYLRRDALDSLGPFDPFYGRGYGEESDWCQRAISRGWNHKLSTRAFVYHSGTKSFLNEEKLKSIAANTQKLLSRYPEYLKQVETYCLRNPLKFHRLKILLTLLEEVSQGRIILYALHADPEGEHAAGTEKHVRRLETEVMGAGMAALEIFPHRDDFRIRGFFQGEKYLDEAFDRSAIDALSALLSNYATILHAHHFWNWSDAAIQSLVQSPFHKKVMTLHDFYLLCPSVNLLTFGNRFCEVETDLDACNRCLKEVVKSDVTNMESYRGRTASYLEPFDTLLVPSQAMYDYWKKGLPNSDRLKVFEHDLAPIIEAGDCFVGLRPPRHEEKPLVAFVGVFGKHKGSELITQSADLLRREGFEVEILGHLFPESEAQAKKIPVVGYEGLAEIKALLAAKRPLIIAHPSLTAESFCFAFYEGLFLSPDSVSVVGKYGNPAQVLGAAEAGVVMESMTVKGLVEACLEARADQEAYVARANTLRAVLHKRDANYSDLYLTSLHAEPRKTRPRVMKPVDVNEAAAREFTVRRTRNPSGLRRSPLRRYLDRHPGLKNVLKQMRNGLLEITRQRKEENHYA